MLGTIGEGGGLQYPRFPECKQAFFVVSFIFLTFYSYFQGLESIVLADGGAYHDSMRIVNIEKDSVADKESRNWIAGTIGRRHNGILEIHVEIY